MSKSKITEQQRDAAYHCGIGWLLQAAYGREFSMMEMGRCKTKFPTFEDWFDALNVEQQEMVERALIDHFNVISM